MGLVCKIFGHRWDACKEICTRCGQKNWFKSEHDWNGCKCTRCGMTRNQGHAWEQVDACTRRCSICGEIEVKHAWDFCTCRKCGQTDDSRHEMQISNSRYENDFVIACCKCGREIWRKPYAQFRRDLEDRQKAADECGCDAAGYHEWMAWFAANGLSK